MISLESLFSWVQYETIHGPDYGQTEFINFQCTLFVLFSFNLSTWNHKLLWHRVWSVWNHTVSILCEQGVTDLISNFKSCMGLISKFVWAEKPVKYPLFMKLYELIADNESQFQSNFLYVTIITFQSMARYDGNERCERITGRLFLWDSTQLSWNSSRTCQSWEVEWVILGSLERIISTGCQTFREILFQGFPQTSTFQKRFQKKLAIGGRNKCKEKIASFWKFRILQC